MSSSIPDSLFHKSSYSQPQNCVEVAEMPSATAVRDTQNRGLGHLLFESREWAGVVATVKADR
ncbi:DUF397 domain-containing protein [Nocardiopsis tropica]|uniref:DUF397 domain-containing protein n=1 Tax=Nocardiopsis tropica TaxID=109330 RepID=A0ABU7KLV4_9ACTN|nr:DUF397 domain-containing protein [Nocardiopsis umidischolae]MEE2050263.1 DUF397 domain-containing protein [Nocardiopsis umidischolae]